METDFYLSNPIFYSKYFIDVNIWEINFIFIHLTVVYLVVFFIQTIEIGVYRPQDTEANSFRYRAVHSNHAPE